MFDMDSDREVGRTDEFKLAGETFVVHLDVRPEVPAAWYDLSPSASSADALVVADQTIQAFLTEEDRKRWQTLRERAKNPVRDKDLSRLCVWLIRTSSGRPFEEALDSVDGPRITEESSTVESSSAEATRAA